MKKILVAGIIFLVTLNLSANAQGIDENRMNRDLEVAKNVLQTLLQDSGDEGFLVLRGRNRIEASYMNDFGVVFTLPESEMYFYRQGIGGRAVISQGGRGNRSTIIQYSDEGTVTTESKVESDSKSSSSSGSGSSASVAPREEIIIGDAEANMEEAVYTFFADYAMLIGQLRDSDRILVSRSSGENSFVWSSGVAEVEYPKSSSMEVKVGDINAYKAGKIDLEEFKNRVKVNRDSSLEGHSDFRMFSSILKQYYSSNMTETYFISREPTFEYLDGLGVIFHVKTYSSYQDGDFYTIPSAQEGRYSAEERNEKVKQLYPVFEEDIKNFILDYGRTVRSLEDDEMLMLKIRVTKCEGCGIPKMLDLSLKASILKQYDQQKITREKALAQIEVKKTLK